MNDIAAKFESHIVKPKMIGRPEVITADAQSQVDLTRNYVIALANRSDTCFQFIRTTKNDGSWNNWTTIGRICRTCSLSSLQQCFDQGKYQPLISITCGVPDFLLQLATPPDANGNSQAWEWGYISASCSFPGGVLFFE